MSKGSTPRPFEVSYSQYQANYDSIFKKPKEIEMQKYVTPFKHTAEIVSAEENIIVDRAEYKLATQVQRRGTDYHVRISRYIPEIDWRHTDYFLSADEYCRLIESLAIELASATAVPITFD